MSKSKIEWTDLTWNPVTGCNKVSQGCRNCYAERMYERFNGKDSFKNIICHEDRLLIPVRRKKPSMVFVNSMSDLFHEKVPFSFIDKVFAIMGLTPQHTYQVLTKRADRMLEYFESRVNSEMMEQAAEKIVTDQPHLFYVVRRYRFENETMEEATNDLRHIIKSAGWYSGISYIDTGEGDAEKEHEFFYEGTWPLPNVWLGVSVEDQKTANERIPLLLQVPAAVRFLSCEPLLGAVKLKFMTGNEVMTDALNGLEITTAQHHAIKPTTIHKIDWVICGGESGPGARPMHPDWARSLRDQCKAAGVPFFFKQWGEWTHIYPQDLSMANRQQTYQHGTSFYKVSKRLAGDILDGYQHHEFPEILKHVVC